MGCISKDENVKSFNSQLLKQQTIFHNFLKMNSFPGSIKTHRNIYGRYICVHICVCVYACIDKHFI